MHSCCRHRGAMAAKLGRCDVIAPDGVDRRKRHHESGPELAEGMACWSLLLLVVVPDDEEGMINRLCGVATTIRQVRGLMQTGVEPQAVSIERIGCQFSGHLADFCSTFSVPDSKMRSISASIENRWALIVFEIGIGLLNLVGSSAAVLHWEAGAAAPGAAAPAPERRTSLGMIERGAVPHFSSSPVFPSAAPPTPACRVPKRLQRSPVTILGCWRSVDVRG